MSEPNKAVFLSYASQDAEAARRICDALRQADIEVWFDQSELRGGDAWDAMIRKRIKECALFLPVISAHTEARVEGYFRREWRLAVERMHDMADDAAFLIPVVIDATTEAQARVPDRFRERQWTHLPGGETPPALCERLRQLLAGPARAAAPAEDVRVPEAREIPGWRPAVGEAVPDTPWVLEAKLGQGGFGEVWLGRHPKLHERRVFKFCFRADRVRSLKRELTLFRVVKERVGEHPNIVRLLDVHFDEPPYYVEMDYVEGQSLKVWCDEKGGADQVPLATRLEIVAQIADALHAAHTAGVIHRDVKPGNILIAQPAATGARPIAKLSDFGIGQILSAEVLEGVTKGGFTQSILAAGASPHSGTQLYMAPELLAGEPATIRTDIYSLGVVLFQLLVGDLHRPLTTDWRGAVGDPCLCADLERCFAGRPAERFEGAELLAKNLRALPGRQAALAAEQVAAAARAKMARRRKRMLVAGVTAIVIGFGAGLTWFLRHTADQRWARETALPEINRLIEKEDFFAAFALAHQAEAFIPREPGLQRLWPRMSLVASFETTPPGAEIYAKEYRRPDSVWQLLGRTPLKDVSLARGFYRWQIKAAGCAPFERAVPVGQSNRFTLDADAAVPPGMVHVEGGPCPTFWMTGMQQCLPDLELKGFLIDRYEVTNRQFKEFVDHGGYTTTAYWKQPFRREGQELSWSEATAQFHDATGRPGPATWKNGTYPDGQADYPVTGVSWFEASAYAEWAGKRLPSLFHWASAAAADWNSFQVVPLSNFAGAGLAPVGRYQGMSPSGACDMAGNAKEWCWNEADPGRRFILGGAWNEPAYMFTSPDARSPFDRSATNGFRCMKLLSAEPLAKGVDDAIPPPSRDYAGEKPVGDEVFRIYRSLYSYDKTDLEARIESADDSDKSWRKEKVSFRAAYGNERVIAYLFLPKESPPPFQTMVFFPSNVALYLESSNELNYQHLVRIVVRSGRAVLYPIYKSTYERRDGLMTTFPAPTNLHRDHVIQWSKDLGRSIDYLETRPDIRCDRLAYVGFSWGGCMGALLPALESRLKACVLIAGGFYIQRALPEADQINFAPRITIPTLMLNGRYDGIFPPETSQIPMFQLLGTPPEHKRHVLYDEGHVLATDQVPKETLAWLDRYLGPVK